MTKVRLGLGALALVAIAACAASDDDGAVTPQAEGDAGGGGSTSDAQAPEPPTDGGGANDATVPKEIERCSPDKWCVTKLPAEDLDLRDIRPFEDRAFAIAESATLGVQFLEWEKTTDAWKYIGDGTQNQFDRGKYAGKMWAASENEVYFTLAPAFVYHGVRSNPSSPFSWKVTRLDDPDAPPPAHDPGRVWTSNDLALLTGKNDPTSPPFDFFSPSLGVEGMPWGEVYAWYGPTLFRRTTAENGDDVWVVEHTLTDAAHPDDEFHIQSITGGALDDFWIGGVRSRVAEGGVRERACPLAVQKRADGYHHFVDHVVNPTADKTFLTWGVCGLAPEAKALMRRYDFPEYGVVIEIESDQAGWVQSLHHIAPNTVIGLMATTNFIYLKSDGDTPIARTLPIEHVPIPIQHLRLRYNSMWMTESGGWASGNGIMIALEHDPTAWSQGIGVLDSAKGGSGLAQASTFELSPIGRGGYPLTEPLHQVRGTSNSNVWAIGNRHAFHRTTP